MSLGAGAKAFKALWDLRACAGHAAYPSEIFRYFHIASISEFTLKDDSKPYTTWEESLVDMFCSKFSVEIRPALLQEIP